MREIHKKMDKKVRIFGRIYYLLYLCTRIYDKCDFFPAARQKANDERGLNCGFGQYLSNMLGVNQFNPRSFVCYGVVLCDAAQYAAKSLTPTGRSLRTSGKHSLTETRSSCLYSLSPAPFSSRSG